MPKTVKKATANGYNHLKDRIVPQTSSLPNGDDAGRKSNLPEGANNGTSNHEPGTSNQGAETGTTVVQNGKTSAREARDARRKPLSQQPNIVIKGENDHSHKLFFESIRLGKLTVVKSSMRSRNMGMNTRDMNNSLAPTALIVACETGRTDIVKLLLTMKKAKYLDVNQEDKMGRRPIWIAALNGNPEIADLLMNTRGTECDVNFTDRETGTSPLYRAILSNNARCVQLLIEAKADVNMRRMGFDMKAETPLIKAVQMDNKEIVELLVNALCKIQARTEEGFNAVHFGVAYKRYEIVEYLLQNEIKIHAKSNNGITAMTVAIEHHNPAMAKLLIEYGYKMDKRYKWKETPLSQAMNLHSEECAMTLIHQGCSLVKKRGPTYFHMAVDEKLVRLMKFMAAVNPHFLQEDWVKRNDWPVSIYHRPDIINWLERETDKVRTLRQLCRGRIFRLMGKYPPHKLKKLNLADNLREYISYTSHVKDEFYMRARLELTGKCPVDCPAICNRKYCPPIEFSSSSESDSSIDDDEIETPPTNHQHHHQEGEEGANKCCDYCQ